MPAVRRLPGEVGGHERCVQNETDEVVDFVIRGKRRVSTLVAQDLQVPLSAMWMVEEGNGVSDPEAC